MSLEIEASEWVNCAAHPSQYLQRAEFYVIAILRVLITCSVIRVILQFCKENGLQESFHAIQVCAARVYSIKAQVNTL